MSEPKRIIQTERGPRGNCQSACLAMMLGLDLSEVPNFWTAGGGTSVGFIAAQESWLRSRGLWMISFAKWEGAGIAWPPPHGFFIAGGVSPRGNSHAVIIRDGEVWHDPHPDGGGIGEVETVDFILPLGFQPLTVKAT